MDSIPSFLAVLLVLGLTGGAVLMLRRRGVLQPAGARRMQVIEKVPLGPQHALHLVKIGERLVLVATTPTTCQILEGVF